MNFDSSSEIKIKKKKGWHRSLSVISALEMVNRALFTSFHAKIMRSYASVPMPLNNSTWNAIFFCEWTRAELWAIPFLARKKKENKQFKCLDCFQKKSILKQLAALDHLIEFILFNNCEMLRALLASDRNTSIEHPPNTLLWVLPIQVFYPFLKLQEIKNQTDFFCLCIHISIQI